MKNKNHPHYFPKQQPQIARASYTQLSIGPIPSAEELSKYESVILGASSR